MNERTGERMSPVGGLERFHHRALFLVASCDTVIGESFQREQMAYFPSATMEIIPHAGHELFTDQPVASVAVVRAYLASAV
jgi:pimeloyl-ACP methyl ester carboxylesterase